MVHLMPCRNPCRLYIHLAFTYSIGPSSVVGIELGPALPFPPMRVLEVQWSWVLGLVREVAIIYKRSEHLNLNLYTQDDLMTWLKLGRSGALVRCMVHV